MNAPPAVASRVVDLVLYFCIWGEGANLRHMPECVWFLYHKMMQEHIRSEGYTQTRSLYAGHFLDNVVRPIYEIVQTVCCSTLLLLYCCWLLRSVPLSPGRHFLTPAVLHLVFHLFFRYRA